MGWWPVGLALSSHATNPFMCPGESNSQSLLTTVMLGTAYLEPAHHIGTMFFMLFSRMHRGGPLCWKGGYTCIPETVTISAALAGG